MSIDEGSGYKEAIETLFNVDPEELVRPVSRKELHHVTAVLIATLEAQSGLFALIMKSNPNLVFDVDRAAYVEAATEALQQMASLAQALEGPSDE